MGWEAGMSKIRVLMGLEGDAVWDGMGWDAGREGGRGVHGGLKLGC